MLTLSDSVIFISRNPDVIRLSSVKDVKSDAKMPQPVHLPYGAEKIL